MKKFRYSVPLPDRWMAGTLHPIVKHSRFLSLHCFALFNCISMSEDTKLKVYHNLVIR